MATQAIYHTVKGKPAELGDTDIDGALEVTGASTLTGAITATGGVVGDVTGGIFQPITNVAATGAIAVPSVDTTFFVTKAGVAVLTMVDPTTVTHDGLRLTFVSTTANAHTLDLVTAIDGGAADIGTWGGAIGDGVTVIAYGGAWYELPGSNHNVTWA